jgi:ankyrin repeat protein
VVKLLLGKGAELEPKNEESRTPPSLAAEMGHEAVMKLLLEKGAQLESQTPNMVRCRCRGPQ